MTRRVITSELERETRTISRTLTVTGLENTLEIKSRVFVGRLRVKADGVDRRSELEGQGHNSLIVTLARKHQKLDDVKQCKRQDVQVPARP